MLSERLTLQKNWILNQTFDEGQQLAGGWNKTISAVTQLPHSFQHIILLKKSLDSPQEKRDIVILLKD